MSEVAAQYDEAGFVWIDALDPADSDFSRLQERFGMHGLAVKDSMSPAQVPKVDVYGDQIFVVLKLARLEGAGRKTLIIAGVWTSVCVMFPALDAKAAGFKVYAVMDASGDPSALASRATLARFVQAGVIPTSANAVLSETHRTWNRPEAAELARLYSLVAPNYAAVVESYQKAQDVIKQQQK